MSTFDPSLFDTNQIQRKIESGEYFSDNSKLFNPTRLRSEKQAADYKKFILLLSKIIDITNESRERKVSFMSNSSYDRNKDVVTPIVTYKTVSRVPANEVKPRFREVVNDQENNNRTVNVLGQQFKYTLELRIVDSSDEEAEDIMSDIEDTILTYSGFFMAHGVSNIRFLEQLPDDVIFTTEQFYTKRLVYSVILEKITLQSEDKIRTIIQRISVD